MEANCTGFDYATALVSRENETGPPQSRQAGSIETFAMTQVLVTGNCVTAFGCARHLLGREPVAIDRSHIDEP